MTGVPVGRADEAEGAVSPVDPARLVFLGGLHRSGTTPLARLLSASAQVSGLVRTGVPEDEGQHLQAVYPAARTYGGAGRFALDPRAHLTEGSPLVSRANAERVLAAWQPYWEDPQTTLLLEKSPPNMVMGRFLQALFPGSTLVVVLRHPVVVALGTAKWRRLLSRHWWNHATIHEMVGNWLAAADTLRDDVPALDRVHVLRYEDLISDPTTELASLQSHLGLAEPLADDALDSTRSDAYVRQWARLCRNPIGRRLRARVERDYGAGLSRYGYRLDDLLRPDPWSGL